MLNKLDERTALIPAAKPIASGRRQSGQLASAITAQLEKDVNLFDLYWTDRIFDFYLGVVHPDYRKHRVSQTMGRLSTKITRSINNPPVGAIKMVAFSHYAARNPNNELVKSIDYATFQLADGSRPLAGVDLWVHKSARLLVLPLNNNTRRSSKQTH